MFSPLPGILLCVVVALGLLGQGARAVAEGPVTPQKTPPPRAVTVARGFISAEYAPSFTALVTQAIAAANDLTTASRRAREVVVERATIESEIAALGVRTVRAGANPDRLERQALLLSADPAGVPANLSQDERDAVDQMTQLRAGLVRYRDSLAAEQDALTRAGLWSLASGDAPWVSPLDGRISQPFGPSTYGAEPPRTVEGVAYAHYHDGIDVVAPLGTPIVAAAAGQVIFVGHIADGAQVVLVAHTGGYVTEYGHLDDSAAMPVKAGDVVQQGQVIGRVGMTGNTSGPHLHLQIWHGGALADPATLIRAYR